MTRRCHLKDLIELSKDGEWGESEPFEQSVEAICIRGTDFQNARVGVLDSSPHRHIPSRVAAVKTLRPWDLLIETAGGTKDQITGRTVLLRPSLFRSAGDTPLICASFARFIRFRSDVCDPEFMFWYLQHLYFGGFLHAYHTQHTGVSRFQWTTFASTEPIHLPPRDVQERIVRILAPHDLLIENNLRRIQILEEMARAVYRELFVELKAPGVSVAIEDGVPAGWRVVRLASVADVNRAQINTKAPPERVLYIDISSVGPGVVREVSDLAFADAPGRARRIVQHGDILWSCVRPNRRSHALVLNPDPDTVGSTGFAVLTATNVPFTFLYQATTTDAFVAYLTSHATGAAYPAVTAKTFEDAEILLPTADLLERFAHVTTPMAELIANLHRQNANLRATRDLLLPRLMSGQLSSIPDVNAQLLTAAAPEGVAGL